MVSHPCNELTEGARSGSSSEAAVAIILSEREGRPSILLIRRRESPNDPWSGHVALPGGRRRPEDRDLLATVIREVAEEVGIDLSRFEPTTVIGPCSPSNAPNLSVTVFVFNFGARQVSISTGGEVSEAFWVPICELLNSTGEAVLPSGRRVRAFIWRDKVIWGFTYRVLSEFFRSLE